MPLDHETKTSNDPLIDALDRLKRISFQLSSIGQAIVVLAILGNLIPLVSGMFFRAGSFVIQGGVPALAFSGIALLIFWDQSRKRGMAIYNEISDEVEWDFNNSRNFENRRVNVAAQPSERPELKLRLVLREFLNSATLPLAPHDWGTILYLVLFVMSMLINFVAFRFLGTSGLLI